MNALQPSPAESPAVENAATMRTLVGVDEGRSYIPAIRLLARLDFKGNEAILVHVEQPIGTVYNPVPLAYDYGDDANAERQAREFGETLLEEAASAARLMDLGKEPKTVYALGTSSGRLMEVADEEGADLVAIGSRRQGTLESFFLGSVGRALAIAANQSFLVARGRPASDGAVRAVFASDHSEYADRCFVKFLEMAPEGVGHVTIVTATEPSMGQTYCGSLDETALAERGAAMVQKLTDRGISGEFRTVAASPEAALRTTMSETGSDLLILGARGHGLIERLLIGSLALHVVVAEPYSVMVLRLPVQS